MTITKQHIAFPEAVLTVSEEGIKTYSTRRGDTEIKVSYIPPGAKVPLHEHKEAQIGMVVKGELTMTVGNVTRVMRAENESYVAPPYVPHGAVNDSGEETISIDVKRYRPSEVYTYPPGYFIEAHSTRDLVPGMKVTFFVESWFELMLAGIPANGGEMPDHKHRNEQLGICIGGQYYMTVENETVLLKFGDTYFSGDRERHSAINPFPDGSRSINLFFPPRYHTQKSGSKGRAVKPSEDTND